jgi:rRNA small subunit pseudouridine methyltransferase Nep1
MPPNSNNNANKKRKAAEALLAPIQEDTPAAPATSAAATEADSDDENDVSTAKPVIILLDQARLETVKTRKGDYEVLNCDDHRDLLRKSKKDHKEYRPDIAHQELLALIDSPLNKAGKLKVYMRTNKNVLVEFNPAVRIPRTYKRFSGLMVQLLHKMKIKAADSNVTLLKVIKNPFHNHLPAGCRVYGMSRTGTLYNPASLADKVLGGEEEEDKGKSVCFVVGAMATGHVTVDDHPYIESMFSISEYPLSGACALSRITGAIEQHMGIV